MKHLSKHLYSPRSVHLETLKMTKFFPKHFEIIQNLKVAIKNKGEKY